MKKLIIAISAFFLSVCLLSCSESSTQYAPHDTTETAKQTVHTHEWEEDSQKIFYGAESQVYEIVLPRNGETVEYDPPLNVFTDENGFRVEAHAAEREGNTIHFYTKETAYYFDPVFMQIVTADGELFISLNGVLGDNGTYRYDIHKWEKDTETYDYYLNRLKYYLGDAYRSDLDYYLVSMGNVYETPKK